MFVQIWFTQMQGRKKKTPIVERWSNITTTGKNQTTARTEYFHLRLTPKKKRQKNKQTETEYNGKATGAVKLPKTPRQSWRLRGGFFSLCSDNWKPSKFSRHERSPFLGVGRRRSSSDPSRSPSSITGSTILRRLGAYGIAWKFNGSKGAFWGYVHVVVDEVGSTSRTRRRGRGSEKHEKGNGKKWNCNLAPKISYYLQNILTMFL